MHTVNYTITVSQAWSPISSPPETERMPTPSCFLAYSVAQSGNFSAPSGKLTCWWDQGVGDLAPKENHNLPELFGLYQVGIV